MKRVLLVVISLVFVLLLVGCEKNLHTKSSIVKYIYEEYGFESEVISENIENDYDKPEEYSEHKKFVMKQKDRDVFFNCESYYNNSPFGYRPRVTDDYYNKLTDSIMDDINQISQKYHVEFWRDNFKGLIGTLKIFRENEEKIDFYNIECALNELMQVYDIRKIEDYFIINIEVNNVTTIFYYPYVHSGDKIKRYGLGEEFIKENEISEKFIEDLESYINVSYPNGIYSVKPFIDSWVLVARGEKTGTYRGTDGTYLVYTIHNNSNVEHKKIDINIEKYMNDYSNNTLKDFEEYIGKSDL